MPDKALTQVAGIPTEQPTNGRLLYGGGMVRDSLPAGVSETIPAGYQVHVSGSFTADGSLTVDGKLVLL